MYEELDEQITEKLTTRRRVFDGYIVHIDHVDAILPNGKPALREIAVHNGASAIVPIDENGDLYLVRQFRAPLGRVIMEIPAGKLDTPDEDRLSAAKRELREETGLTARKWAHLTDMPTTPGFCSEVISLYLAQDLQQKADDPDEDEFLNIVKIPFAEAVERVMSGELSDSKTACAILMADRILKTR